MLTETPELSLHLFQNCIFPVLLFLSLAGNDKNNFSFVVCVSDCAVNVHKNCKSLLAECSNIRPKVGFKVCSSFVITVLHSLVCFTLQQYGILPYVFKTSKGC